MSGQGPSVQGVPGCPRERLPGRHPDASPTDPNRDTKTSAAIRALSAGAGPCPGGPRPGRGKPRGGFEAGGGGVSSRAPGALAPPDHASPRSLAKEPTPRETAPALRLAAIDGRGRPAQGLGVA